MVRIKLGLFEGLVACTIFPNIGLLFSTLLLFAALVSKVAPVFYKWVFIAYAASLGVLLLSVLICFIIHKASKNEFVLYEDQFVFCGRQYPINQIKCCEYYVCKWYAIPIAFVYKQQVAGLISIKLHTGEKIKFKLLYKDYRTIKKRIKCNIVEK